MERSSIWHVVGCLLVLTCSHEDVLEDLKTSSPWLMSFTSFESCCFAAMTSWRKWRWTANAWWTWWRHGFWWVRQWRMVPSCDKLGDGHSCWCIFGQTTRCKSLSWFWSDWRSRCFVEEQQQKVVLKLGVDCVKIYEIFSIHSCDCRAYGGEVLNRRHTLSRCVPNTLRKATVIVILKNWMRASLENHDVWRASEMVSGEQSGATIHCLPTMISQWSCSDKYL